MTSRVLVASLAALVGLTVTVPTASATDFFATTDNAATSQDCLTEATACALGRAMNVIPNVPGNQPSVGVHTLTLLPGDYDTGDFEAGSPFVSGGRLDIKRGLTVQGKSGAAVPTIDVSAAPSFDVGIRMDSGGILRHVKVVRSTAGAAVRVGGFAAQNGNPGVVGTLDRVTVSASAPLSTGFSSAVTIQDFGVVKNSLLKQSGGDPTQVSAATVQAVSSDGAPQVIGSTLLSATGAALAVLGSTIGSPTATQVGNSALQGAPDLDVSAQAGTPVTISLTNSAWRNAAPGTITSGPVTIDAKTTPVTGDFKLDGGGKPLEGSVLIDAGAALADLGAFDLDGNARVSGSAPDIGAFEVTAATPAPTGGNANPTPTTNSPQPQGPPATQPAPDTTGPNPTSLNPPKTLKRSKLSKGKGVTLTATLDEKVSSAKVELLQITTKKGKAPKEKLLGSATLGAGGPSLTFPLKIKASKLGKKGKLKLTLRFTFVDTAGNKTVVDKAVTVG